MAVMFDSIGGGELAERFQIAMAQIGRNILDPNMDPEAARGMTINLKFKPKPAGSIDVEYEVKVKLAELKKSGTKFLIGQDLRSGRIEINEYGNNIPRATAVATAQIDPPDELDNQNKGPIDLRRAVND